MNNERKFVLIFLGKLRVKDYSQSNVCHRNHFGIGRFATQCVGAEAHISATVLGTTPRHVSNRSCAWARLAARSAGRIHR